MKANKGYVMEQIRIYEMYSELFLKMSKNRKYETLSEEQIESIKFRDLKEDLKYINKDPYLLIQRLNNLFEIKNDFENKNGEYYSLNKKMEIKLNPGLEDLIFFDKVTSYVGYNGIPIYTISYGLYEEECGDNEEDENKEIEYAYYSINSENYFNYNIAMKNFEERILSDNPKDVFGKYNDMNAEKPSYVKPLM